MSDTPWTKPRYEWLTKKPRRINGRVNIPESIRRCKEIMNKHEYGVNPLCFGKISSRPDPSNQKEGGSHQQMSK